MKEPPAINNRRPLRSPSLPIQGRARTAENENTPKATPTSTSPPLRSVTTKRATVGITDEKPSAENSAERHKMPKCGVRRRWSGALLSTEPCLLTTANTAGRRSLLVTANVVDQSTRTGGVVSLNFSHTTSSATAITFSSAPGG